MKRKLYQNGTILTMGHPAQASSVLVEDGVIRALDADRAGLADVEIVDLRGRTMLPAFLDAHSHLSAVANGLLQCSLEDCADFDAIRRQISDYIARKKIPAGQWVLAKGYDQTALREGKHPTLAVLDAAAPEHPLMLQHRSGHVGVVNSLGLRRLGLTPETPDPSGGKIGREITFLEPDRLAHTGIVQIRSIIDDAHGSPGQLPFDAAAKQAALRTGKRKDASRLQRRSRIHILTSSACG